MKLLRDKPHLLIWLIIPLFLLIGVIDSQRPIELWFDQTIIAMTVGQIVIKSVVVLISTGIVYWLLSLTNKKILWGFTLTHIVLTSGSLLLITSPLFDSDALMNKDLFDLTKFTFLLGQLFLGINVVWTLLSRSVNK